ncbi:MAG: hypothetical protein ACYC7E_03015 [Armatimonadota bacterium]
MDAWDSWYDAYLGLAPRRIPHYEAWSCPDAETYITGIDYYDHPRHCRQRMVEVMLDTARMTGGYAMSIGNHIPWNVTPEGVKRYLDLSAELGFRE